MQPDLSILTILVTIPMTKNQCSLLEEKAPGSHFQYVSQESVSLDQVQSAQVILGNVPPHLLEGSRDLHWLQLNSAGANLYTTPGLLPADAQLTNASGAYGLAISEHLTGLCLMLSKKLHLYRDNQNRSIWRDEGSVNSIVGSKTLVVGLGDIGRQFAKRMNALGSTVIGIRRVPSAGHPDYVSAVYGLDQLDELLPHVDFIALTLPDTPQTLHLMNKDRLGRLKSTAILLNIGRGNAIDTEALCDALITGQLGGAGLDVTDPEPLPSDHRLWSIPNVVITPHVSGGFHLQATLDSIIELAINNLGHFMLGEPLENRVDLATGYRVTVSHTESERHSQGFEAR